ncbi:MAG TPA: MBL fold metallo-hydrolase [Bacillota bacterium]|nr:MBL fold metallo-hydrolase [Bacillota bacterium]
MNKKTSQSKFEAINVSKIYGINLAGANVYLIKGAKGYVLVDAGPPGTDELLLNHLQKYHIQLPDIKLIVITHVHYDHVGNLAFLKEKCNCLVLVHAREKELLETAKIVVPPATGLLGKIISWVGNLLPTVHQSFTPVKPDIVISSDFSLQDYGIEGSALETPGHTNGSISVVLKDTVAGSAAFVGDLAFNLTSKAFPLYAESSTTVWESWKKLMDSGALQIYPGHGKWPFPVERMVREYTKYKKA